MTSLGFSSKVVGSGTECCKSVDEWVRSVGEDFVFCKFELL